LFEFQCVCFSSYSVCPYFHFAPIHRASIRGYTEVVSNLLKGGADPNAQDYEGYTPLHFAAKSGHYETAEILYRSGGDPLKTNDFIFTPLDFAQRYRFDDLVTLLNTPRAKLPPVASARTIDTPKSGMSFGSGDRAGVKSGSSREREKILADILNIKE
jgi:ankyrin repeat protein